ncbi:MAG TPA: hypothetical protein VE046_13895 [Steroidobacteraceae bacterium]|nr:hypothetical protein [Steroidobacteraceae bacterium]
MKGIAAIATLVALASFSMTSAADESQTGRVHYEFDQESGKTLSLNIRSAEVVIEGSDTTKFTIGFDGEKADQATAVKVTYKVKGDVIECGITEGPHNDFRILIGVPAITNLVVRMPAGVLQMNEVRGSKDVKMHAGDLDINIGDADDYASIDASVTTGEIDVSALGAETGGFFRKFHRSGPGSFRLLVHMGAGQLTLQ